MHYYFKQVKCSGDYNNMVMGNFYSLPRFINGNLYDLSALPYLAYMMDYDSGYGEHKEKFFYNTENEYTNYIDEAVGDRHQSYYRYNRLLISEESFTVPDGYAQYTTLTSDFIKGKRSINLDAVTDSHTCWYQPIKFNFNNKDYIGIRFAGIWADGSKYNYSSAVEKNQLVQFARVENASIVWDTVITERGFDIENFPDVNIDFGSAEQEVCQYFSDWFYANTSEPKTAKIIIKNEDKILAQTDFIAPYTSLTLSTTNNICTIETSNKDKLSFYVDNNFTGLSKSELAIIPTIQDGKTNLFSSNTVENFWLCYKKGREQPNSFLCSFYCCSAEENRVDKTNYLSDKKDFYITLKGEANILGFSILLEIKDLPEIWTIPKWNYCYVPNFNRYYFANLISVYNNVWEFELKVDALMSFKNEISKLYGMVDRNEKEFDKDIPDDLIVTKAYPTIDINKISGTSDLFRYDSDAAGEYNYLVILRG